MIVTALRSFVESHGGDFSAKWAGKWKMLFQCAAAAFGIGQLMYYDAATRTLAATLPAWISWGLVVSLWLAIVFTVYSGVGYIVAAAKMIRDAE